MSEEQNHGIPFFGDLLKRVEEYRLKHMPSGTVEDAAHALVGRLKEFERRVLTAEYDVVKECVGQDDFALVIDIATAEQSNPAVFDVRDLSLAITEGMSLDDFLKHRGDAAAWLREHESES